MSPIPVSFFLQHGSQYGRLVKGALRGYGVLCLGLYRLIDPTSKDAQNRKRFVITSPPYNFRLLSSDRVRYMGLVCDRIQDIALVCDRILYMGLVCNRVQYIALVCDRVQYMALLCDRIQYIYGTCL